MILTNSRIFTYAIVFAMAVATISLIKRPLHDVHWDTPIYLLRGKAVAQTPLLESYQSHAKTIAEDLSTYRPGVIDTPYWGFSRIGNSIILGALTSIIGTGPAQLRIITGFYSFILAFSVALALAFCISLLSYIDPRLNLNYAALAAFFSAGLYVISDVYRHMTGNLVAEVPALLLVSACGWAIVEAFKKSSILLAITSGVLAFSIYTVKVELVWAYISFILLFSLFVYYRTKDTTACLVPLLVSGSTALILYAIYAWWFYPLADPRLFLTFVAAEKEQPMTPVAPFKLWFAAGGLLWLGLVLSLIYKPRHPALWLAIVWLLAMTLPHYNSLIYGHMAQVRYFALIMPPLFIASTLGWTELLQSLDRHKSAKPMLACTLVLAAFLASISHVETYSKMKQLPGAWRLQYVRTFLGPPPYERRDFHVDDIQAVTHFLYQQKQPIIVIIGQGIHEEYGNIIKFFGPRLPDVDPFDNSDSIGQCGRKSLRPTQEPIMFCSSPPSAQTIAMMHGRIPIYYLHATDKQSSENSDTSHSTIFSTDRLFISVMNPTAQPLQ